MVRGEEYSERARHPRQFKGQSERNAKTQGQAWVGFGQGLERIVTHRFPIERGVEAIELFDSRRSGKVVFEYE